MYPGVHAESTPDKPAVIMAGSGARLTYRQLEDESRRLAGLLHEGGLRPGDHISILMENRLEYFVAFWAGIRSGLYVTAVNRYLQPPEVAYILQDSACKALITSREMGSAAADLLELAPDVQHWLRYGGGGDGFTDLAAAVADVPARRLDGEPRGEAMLYSSGTTGRPKGIKRRVSGLAIDDPGSAPSTLLLLAGLFGFDAETVYLSPAPLYHAAPLGFTTGTQCLGGTCVIMERFDAAHALQLIDEYSITHSQWVPTMFGRILKAEPDVLEAHDGSSHRVAIHAAAPCPVEIKKRIFDLWGPIIHEYYAGTEVNGFVYCAPQDWLDHPGTVGRSILGTVRICDENGTELPPGEPGTIYFERDEVPFHYHNDPEKTRSAIHPDHPTWSTLGDIGYLDDDGFLYLTDRKAFMIISGGVNIYPQEIEDCLIMHPDVADVAVIGVPHDDMGEEVKAVVQLEDGIEPDDGKARELIDYSRQHLASFKAPRSVDFRPELPRLPTGKLYKRLLRDEYWGPTATAGPSSARPTKPGRTPT